MESSRLLRIKFLLHFILIDINGANIVSRIFYAESYTGIYSFLPSTQNSQKLYSIYGYVRGIECDFKGNLLFWNNESTISAAPINDLQGNMLSIHGSETLLRSDRDISKIAYDWIHKLLYYPYCDSDNEENTGINVINIMRPKQIHKIKIKNIAYIRDIAVDPINSIIAWSSRSLQNEGLIVISNQDGSNARVLVSNLTLAVTITLDISRATLYWIDRNEGTLSEISYNETNRKVIITSKQLFKDIFQMDVYGDNIYWSHHGTDSVLMTNKYGLNGTNMLYQLKSARNDIEGIKIISSLRQGEATDGCKLFNCSQLCIPASQHKYRCVCDLDEKCIEMDFEYMFENKSSSNTITKREQTFVHSKNGKYTIIGIGILLLAFVVFIFTNKSKIRFYLTSIWNRSLLFGYESEHNIALESSNEN